MSSWVARRDLLINRPSSGPRRPPQPPAVLAWSYNAADYSAATGTATDSSGNSRDATQSNAAIRPDENPTGLNGLPTVDFVGANLDVLNVQNATFVCAGVFEFITEWVLQKPLGAASELLLRVASGTVNASLYNLQIDENGFIVLATRRLGGDTSSTVTSSFQLLDSVPHYLLAGVNWLTGQVYFQLDGAEETKQVRTAGAPGWQSGLGTTDPNEALVAPIIGRNSSTLLNASIAEHNAWVGLLPMATRSERRDDQQAVYDTVLQKVEWNAPDRFFAYRSYQQEGGEADGIFLTGRVIAGDPGATIAIRLVDALTGDPAPAPYDAFQDLATAVGGNFEVTLDNVPVGHWKPQAKISGDEDYNSATRAEWFSVTNIYEWDGQSNLRKVAGNESNVTPYPVTKPGSGSILLGRRLSQPGGPWADITATLTATFNSAGTGETQEPPNGPTSQNVGGGGLVEFNRLYYERAGFAPSHFFVTIGGSPQRNYKDGEANDDFVVSVVGTAPGANLPGPNSAGFIMGSGEDETSEVGYTGAQYEDDLLDVAELKRTRAGKTAEELPGYLQILPPMVTSEALTATKSDDILDAQLAVIDDEDNNIHLASNLRCGPRADNQHAYLRAYYQYLAPMFEATAAHVEGREATGGRGPRFTSATLVAGTREMRLVPTHDGPAGTKLAGRKGADLTDPTVGTLDQDATGLSQFSDRRPTTDTSIGVANNVTRTIGADSTGSKFTSNVGSFITDGFKVGDVVEPAGFAGGGAANNGQSFTIAGLSALNMTVTPAPTTIAQASGVVIEVNPGHLGTLKVKSALGVETTVEITEAFLDSGDEVVLRWSTGPTLESGGQCAFRHQRGNEPPRHMCIFDTQGRPAQPSRSTVRGNGGWQYHNVP